MPKTIEVLLSRVRITENGEDRLSAAATLLSVSLAYPNVLTPTRTTVKALKLKDAADVNFATGTNPETNKPYTYADRIFFKETLQGRTMLTVSLVTVHKTSKLEKFLAGLFGAVFGAAWKLLVGGITNVLVGAAVEAVGAAHVKSFEVDDEKSNPIGEGLFPFDENSVPNPLNIPLLAPDDLTVERFQLVPPNPQPQKVNVHLLTKGQNNGSVDLEINIL